MKRAALIFLIFALAVSAAGCGMGADIEPGSSPLGAYSDRGEKVETVPPRNEITMVFYEAMDFHPLTATNIENHELLKLVYSPLVRLNGGLKPEYVLAKKVEIKGLEVTVTLKKGLKFSDGSAVTAEDLDASIQTVRENPASPYYSRLTNIEKYKVKDTRTLTITLKEPDIDFINCLDLPIVKKGKNVGCGPYKFATEGGKRVLKVNKHYFEKPMIETIHLKAPKSEKERQEMFAVGLLDVYFDSAETEQKFAGGKGFSTQIYPGDNLLYLGINCREGLLQNAKFRGFLNRITAREKLVEGALLGQAETAIYPYQPHWYKAEQSAANRALSDSEKAAAIKELGLTSEENVLLDAEGNPLSFRLLACEENEMHASAAQAVAEGLKIAGIAIDIETVPRADYQARLAEGNFDLYLGEMKTGRTLNPALYAAESAVNFSGGVFPELQQAAADYKSGNLLLGDYCKVFDQYTPILPLAYRGGTLFASADIGEFKSTGSWAVYGDITKLIVKETEKSI